jgi:hypothetical protein
MPSRLYSAGRFTEKYNQIIPTGFLTFGPCTGEEIQVTGTLHVVTMVENNVDQVRAKTHLNTNLEGVGRSSGLRYRLQQITNSNFEMAWASGAYEQDQIFHMNVISSTAAPNFYLTMNATARWDPITGFEFVPKKWETVCR